MKGIELYIDKWKNDLLVNKYGSYKFLYHNQTGGPGFHSQFDFKVTPYETNENYETITLEFAKTLERFETVIRERFIYEGFKKGLEKFVHKISKEGINLTNSIKIEILDYKLHAIDSKPICNEICFDQVLSHIYNKTQLSPTAIFEVVYEEYDTIYLKLNEIGGVSINNQIVKWATSYEELSNTLELKHGSLNEKSNLKHFIGTKSINYSNTIINKAYNFDIGFNDKNEFIEMSFQIGFKIKIGEWNINYYDSIEELINIGKQKGFNIAGDGNGNYKCEELGIIFSESPYNDNKFHNGFLEYIYITKPKTTGR